MFSMIVHAVYCEAAGASSQKKISNFSFYVRYLTQLHLPPLRFLKLRGSNPVAGVLNEPYSKLTPLSGVAVQAACIHRLEPCPSILCRLASGP